MSGTVDADRSESHPMPTLVRQCNREEDMRSVNKVLKELPDRCVTQNGRRTSCSCLGAAEKATLCQLIREFRAISYDDDNLKHYFAEKAVLVDDTTKMDLPFRFRFCQEGSDNYTEPTEIILCWNGTARLFFLATQIPYEKFSAYLHKDETRRTLRRKILLFKEVLCLAQYKVKRRNLRQPSTKVDWSDVCFADLTARQKRSIGTLKKDCCHFGLKNVVDEHLLFAIPQNRDCDDFLEKVNGQIVHLSDDTALQLENIRIRANALITSVAATEITLDPRECRAKVIRDPCGTTSVNTGTLHASITNALAYHIFGAIHTARAKGKTDNFGPNTGKLGCAWSFETTIVRSSRYAPQKPHRKFSRHPLHPRRPTGYIAVAPLSKSGSIIQIWPTAGEGGRLLFLPVRSIIVLPTDVVLGEGFLTSMTTKNLRLRFYFNESDPRPNGSMQPVTDIVYLPDSDYPQSPSLFPGGPLAKMLQLDG